MMLFVLLLFVPFFVVRSRVLSCIGLCAAALTFVYLLLVLLCVACMFVFVFVV